MYIPCNSCFFIILKSNRISATEAICLRENCNVIELLGDGLAPNLFNTLRTGSFKLFKRPLPGFFKTILTL